MNRLLLILAFLGLANQAFSKDVASLFVVAETNNNIVQILRKNDISFTLVGDVASAVRQAKKGDGLLFLAEKYPEKGVSIDNKSLSAIRKKQLRAFVEYPENVPGIVATGSKKKINLERGVVTTGGMGGLDSLSLLAIHDHQFFPLKAKDPLMVLGKVAGFIRADYGIDDVDTHPLLFKSGNFLVGATKISDVIDSRFGPTDSWKKVWNFILADVLGSEASLLNHWDADLKPTYGRDQQLDTDALSKAVEKGTNWFYKAKLFIHPSWEVLFQQRTQKNGEHVVFPGVADEVPLGDGSLGILEGHASFIRADGSQPYRWWLRADCQAEVAWALASASKFLNNTDYKTTSENLLVHLYKQSNLRRGERNDPKSPSFGLIGWATTDPDAYYGDDNARAILATIGAAGAMDNNEFDEYILEAIIGNFRTTGKLGFRGPWFRDAAMQKTTWQALSSREISNIHPHYESWLWACYLWLYDKTGHKPLLEQAKKAIAITMKEYPKWKWTNGIQQEYARMILPLAWLVRVEDKPEHRQWLDLVTTKLLEDMDVSGAIREELGLPGLGRYEKIASNAEYGTKEAPLISDNGDPVSDLLYTCNFAFFTLNEAAYATNSPKYHEAVKKLAEFMVRIQMSSARHRDLDGAWVRAFDYHQWDYWASNADSGWGPWGTLTGWTQSWILNSLILHKQQESFWDKSAKTYKNSVFKLKADEKMRSMMTSSNR